MSTETLWQRERRAARSDWWRQVVLAGPVASPWDEVLDEATRMRFRPAADETGAAAWAEYVR